MLKGISSVAYGCGDEPHCGMILPRCTEYTLKGYDLCAGHVEMNDGQNLSPYLLPDYYYESGGYPCAAGYTAQWLFDTRK